MNLKLKSIAFTIAVFFMFLAMLLGMANTLFPNANVSIDDALLCLGAGIVMFIVSFFFKKPRSEENEDAATTPKEPSIYEEICSEFNALVEKTEHALLDLLASRGIESINMKAYADNEDINKFYFPQTDKNGYGVNVSIDTIRKSEDGKWIADVVDENDDDWGTLDLNRMDFSDGALLDILGLVERVFKCADNEHSGHVLAAGEDFDDIEN